MGSMKAFTVFVLLGVVSGAHSSSRDESCSNHDKAMDDALKIVCAKTCMRWSVVNSYVSLLSINFPFLSLNLVFL